MKQVITTEGSRPIKIWTDQIEDSALQQLKNIATLPFIDQAGRRRADLVEVVHTLKQVLCVKGA